MAMRGNEQAQKATTVVRQKPTVVRHMKRSVDSCPPIKVTTFPNDLTDTFKSLGVHAVNHERDHRKDMRMLKKRPANHTKESWCLSGLESSAMATQRGRAQAKVSATPTVCLSPCCSVCDGWPGVGAFRVLCCDMYTNI